MPRGWTSRGRSRQLQVFPMPSRQVATSNRMAVARRAATGALGYVGGKLVTTGLSKIDKFFRRRKNRLHQSGKVAGTGGSFSKFFYGKRRTPKAYYRVEKALQPQYYVKNGAQRFTSSVGKQNVTSPISMFTPSELETLFGLQGSGKTEKMLFKSVTAELLITNQDKGNARITLYDCIARRDAGNSTSGSPDASWNNGYADQGGTVNTTYLIPGTTPFSSDLFTQMWKVLKVTHIVMAQGQTHVHRIHFAPNRVLDREYELQNNYALKGLSCFTMVVLSSVPYNDATTKTDVSLGSGAVDIVYRKQYKFKYLQNNIAFISASNSLATSFAVNEDVMDIGSGEAEVDAQA